MLGSLQELHLRDLSDHNSRFPSLLMMAPRTDGAPEPPLLAFQFEQNPITGVADYQLHIDLLKHIKFVVSRAFIECLGARRICAFWAPTPYALQRRTSQRPRSVAWRT